MDFNQNSSKLQKELRILKYSNFSASLVKDGDPLVFLSVLHYLMLEYSPVVTSTLAEYELYGKSDQAFMRNLYLYLRDKHRYKPKISQKQFFKKGFANAKCKFISDVIEIISKIIEEGKRHAKKQQYSIAKAETDSGPTPKPIPQERPIPISDHNPDDSLLHYDPVLERPRLFRKVGTENPLKYEIESCPSACEARVEMDSGPSITYEADKGSGGCFSHPEESENLIQDPTLSGSIDIVKNEMRNSLDTIPVHNSQILLQRFCDESVTNSKSQNDPQPRINIVGNEFIAANENIELESMPCEIRAETTLPQPYDKVETFNENVQQSRNEIVLEQKVKTLEKSLQDSLCSQAELKEIVAKLMDKLGAMEEVLEGLQDSKKDSFCIQDKSMLSMISKVSDQSFNFRGSTLDFKPTDTNGALKRIENLGRKLSETKRLLKI